MTVKVVLCCLLWLEAPTQHPQSWKDGQLPSSFLQRASPPTSSLAPCSLSSLAPCSLLWPSMDLACFRWQLLWHSRLGHSGGEVLGGVLLRVRRGHCHPLGHQQSHRCGWWMSSWFLLPSRLRETHQLCCWHLHHHYQWVDEPVWCWSYVSLERERERVEGATTSELMYQFGVGLIMFPWREKERERESGRSHNEWVDEPFWCWSYHVFLERERERESGRRVDA